MWCCCIFLQFFNHNDCIHQSRLEFDGLIQLRCDPPQRPNTALHDLRQPLKIRPHHRIAQLHHLQDQADCAHPELASASWIFYTNEQQILYDLENEVTVWLAGVSYNVQTPTAFHILHTREVKRVALHNWIHVTHHTRKQSHSSTTTQVNHTRY